VILRELIRGFFADKTSVLLGYSGQHFLVLFNQAQSLWPDFDPPLAFKVEYEFGTLKVDPDGVKATTCEP
jgi:hypothetical protein